VLERPVRLVRRVLHGMKRERRIAWRAAAVAGTVAAALALGAAAASADDWGQRVAGQHVYDTAHVLTPAQVSDLERSAAAVDRAGAPAVVYLRRKAADDPTARRDARDLMDAWTVESSPGARDGLVLLFDLRPADANHGSAALVAGASHAGGGGRLSDSRLQAIYDDRMKPRLAAGDLAGAVSAALSATVTDLATAPATSAPSGPPQAAQALFFLAALAAVVIFALVATARGYGGGRGPRSPAAGAPPDASTLASGSAAHTSVSTFTDGGASSGSSSGGGSF
jgi:uncharacterized membrane protein YgcG